ncbi:hypothetical protein Mlab_0585 [Methanocorpusculum labreanum Z]|uniref:Flavodoxin domain-containing protein n=1 Tax=Methanocorpusculum labreanum (strain ATCC 43576 / DSM 4855 / Z) TaxID=410358 RepID=A2SR03_METLZ|nr:hypothetical protein [Methanocorpusculum labreanum]ABN06759.1 hypothetical protein Mlab_0585 [Methanocorpusculum labreanum Z]
MKAIVYESNTGFTQKYAFMLSEKTGLPAYLLENAKNELHKGDEIFFLGWVCAGKISGYAKAAKIYSVKGTAAVGIMFPDETTIPQLRENNKIKDLPLFFLRGGVAPEKLSAIKRKLLNMIANTVEKAGPKNEGEREVIDVLRIGGDFVRPENLDEIVAFIRGNSN